MGKIKEITIKRFDGGMAYDDRQAAANQHSRAINFDIYKKPSTLYPIRGIESDQDYSGANGAKAYDIGSFGSSFTANSIYGFGRKSGATGTKMFTKSPTASSWSAMNAADGSAAETATGCPVPGTGVITTFDSSGSNVLWFISNSADAIGSGFRMLGQVSFLSSVAADFGKTTLTAASSVVFEPFLLLGQDGNGYCFDANKVHRLNTDASVTSNVFTLTPNWRITSACLYGSYIAMSIKSFDISRVILWDYADSQATENIDFGEGTIIALENINGTLVAVMDKFINTTYNGTGASNGQGSMQIKMWGGGTDVNTITEVKAYGVLAGATENYHFRKNNCIFWYGKVPLDAAVSDSLEGIWAFGRVTDTQPWALSLYRSVPANFEAFHMQGDYTYFAHGNDGSVSRTCDDDTYGLTSSWESPVFDGGDADSEKNFKGSTVTFDKLTSGQTVVLKYRKDGATSWTTLTPAPAQAVGDVKAVFPMDGNFHYCQFRIESTGGAKPSGFKFRFEPLTNAIE